MNLFDHLVRTGMPLIPKAIVGRVARRYVAGSTLDDALATIRTLNGEGAMATADVLGEEVREVARAQAAVAEYHRLLERMHADGVDSNISVKPTLLGLKIDEQLCSDNIVAVAKRAGELGNFVRIDMEDHTCTDATLRIYRRALEEVGNVGVVLQSYLHRTVPDVAALLPLKPNIRLCKGIYREPRSVAWQQYETVRANFVAALEKLVDGGAYVAIATHDEYLVCAGMAIVDRHRLGRGQYEFQMLLGVEPELRRSILAAGHRLRVYVPYGRDWYPYSVRRLRENPTIARHVIRSMLPFGS